MDNEITKGVSESDGGMFIHDPRTDAWLATASTSHFSWQAWRGFHYYGMRCVLRAACCVLNAARLRDLGDQRVSY
jgi:hypothetical protein